MSYWEIITAVVDRYETIPLSFSPEICQQMAAEIRGKGLEVKASFNEANQTLFIWGGSFGKDVSYKRIYAGSDPQGSG